jgi:pilus assembly protein Flp/PilA
MFTYVTVWALNKHAKLQACLRDLRNDRRGVTAMEYGMIAAVTVVVVGGVVVSLDTSLTTIWTSVKTSLATGAAP